MVSGVYCIVCKDTNIQEVYVGSTEDLKKRIREHKYNCNNKNSKKHYNLNVYKFIREHHGFDNWKFIWLELFKTDDTIFLRQLEQNFIDTFPKELILNGKRAFRTEEDRREQIIINNKENNEKAKQKGNCPKCFKSMRKDSISRHLKEACKKNTT